MGWPLSSPYTAGIDGNHRLRLNRSCLECHSQLPGNESSIVRHYLVRYPSECVVMNTSASLAFVSRTRSIPHLVIHVSQPSPYGARYQFISAYTQYITGQSNRFFLFHMLPHLWSC